MASFWPCNRQVNWHFRPQEQPPTCQTRYALSASGNQQDTLHCRHPVPQFWQGTFPEHPLRDHTSSQASAPLSTSVHSQGNWQYKLLQLRGGKKGYTPPLLIKKKCSFCSRPEWVLMPLSLPCFPGLGTYVRASQSRASRGLFGFRHSCKTFTTTLKVLQTTNS